MTSPGPNPQQNPYLPPTADAPPSRTTTNAYGWLTSLLSVGLGILCSLPFLGALWILPDYWQRPDLVTKPQLMLILLRPFLLCSAGIFLILRRRLVFLALAIYGLSLIYSLLQKIDPGEIIALAFLMLVFVYSYWLKETGKLR